LEIRNITFDNVANIRISTFRILGSANTIIEDIKFKNYTASDSPLYPVIEFL